MGNSVSRLGIISPSLEWIQRHGRGSIKGSRWGWNDEEEISDFTSSGRRFLRLFSSENSDDSYSELLEPQTYSDGGSGSSGGQGGGHGGEGGSGSGGHGSGDGFLGDENNDGNGISLWGRYMLSLERHPIVTKAITAALLNLLADLFCQLVVERTGTVDLPRLLGFASIGLLLVGPSLHIWYGLLPRIVSIPGDRGTLLRLALDQLIFSPMSIVLFFGVVLSVEGRSSQVISKLQKDLLPTVIAQWKLWIPFQFINFKFVPPSLQVATASVIGLVWTVYMSYVSHSEDVPV